MKGASGIDWGGSESGLIERSIADDNFAHCLSMMGPIIAWAEELRPGQIISRDEIPMIRMPAEVLLAFVKDGARDQGARGEACRKALDLLAQFRDAAKSRAQPAPEPLDQTELFEAAATDHP